MCESLVLIPAPQKKEKTNTKPCDHQKPPHTTLLTATTLTQPGKQHPGFNSTHELCLSLHFTEMETQSLSLASSAPPWKVQSSVHVLMSYAYSLLCSYPLSDISPLIFLFCFRWAFVTSVQFEAVLHSVAMNTVIRLLRAYVHISHKYTSRRGTGAALTRYCQAVCLKWLCGSYFSQQNISSTLDILHLFFI
jgi:hypothetical protein